MPKHDAVALRERLGYSLQRAMIIVFVIITSTLLFLSFAGPYHHTQFREVIGAAGETLFLLVALSLLVLLLARGFASIEPLSERGLRRIVVALFTVMLSLMIVVLTRFRVVPITDGYVMLDEARFLALNPGLAVDSSSPYYVYFGRYGNNYFLTIVFVWIYRLLLSFGIVDPFLPLAVINAGAITLGNYLVYRIALENGGQQRAVKTLLLLTLNPLSYTMVWWIYSCTLSIPLMVGIVLLGIRAYREANLPRAFFQAAACGLLGALAYYVRPTSCIPLIAAGLVAAVVCLKRPYKIPHCAGMATICCVVLVIFLQIIPFSYKSYFGEELRESNYPISHWIMMGSHGIGEYDAADEAYTRSFPTKSDKTDATLSRTLDNYHNLGLSGTMLLFLRKMGTTFSDGYSQSDVRLAQDTCFSPLFRYLAYDRNGLFVLACQAFRILTLVSMLIGGLCVLRSHNPDFAFLLNAVTIMGGIVFYCLWEAKSVYSVPFVPLMLYCSECGFEEIEEIVGTRLARTAPLSRYRFGRVALLSWCLIIVLAYYPACKTEYTRTIFSQRFYDLNFCDSFEGISAAGTTFEQSFYPVGSFDSLTVYLRTTGEGGELAQYSVRVAGPDGTDVYSSTVDANDAANGMLVINLDHLCPGDGKAYHLVIECLRQGKHEIALLHRRSLALDQYRGASYINGDSTSYDLALTVSRKVTSPFTSKSAFAILFALCTLFVVASFRSFDLFNTYSAKTVQE